MKNVAIAICLAMGFAAGAFGTGGSGTAQTQATAPATPIKWAKGCPAPEKLIGLCGAVENIRNDPSDRDPFEYTYERIVAEAACADPTREPPDLVREKIKAMWSRYESELTCNTFDVTNGNVLKLAVNVDEWQFLDDAMKKWGVNLNRIDPSDGRTVLDYIDYRKTLYEGSDIGIMLDAYHRKLVKYGAKHASELPH